MQEAAQIWCRPSISGMEMNPCLAEAADVQGLYAKYEALYKQSS